MFGISDAPSTAFLVEAEIEGAWRTVIKLLGCRPKDTSSLPDEIVEKWAEYGDGCQEATCAKCDCAVILGPSQALAYDMAPQEWMICCLICATLVAVLYSNGGEIDIDHLAGE